MRLPRFFHLASVLFLIGALIAMPALSLAANGVAVTATIVDAQNQPVSGARVVFKGTAGTMFATHSDKSGRAAIVLPLDTYTIVASRNGYSSESLTNMSISGDTQLSITIVAVAMAAAPAPAPAPAAQSISHVAAAPHPAAAPAANVQAAAPPPPLVHDALVSTYNAHQPEHVKGEPYFGRYTYVLLAGNGATDPRNRALVAALVAKYGVGANGGKQTIFGNPFGYNIFFLPVSGSGKDAVNTSNSPDAILAAYDFKTARYLHDRYCAAAGHTASSICSKPIGQGPFMLTLTRPLEGLRARDTFPAAFAYDLSGVAPDQYAAAVAIVARTTNVPDPMQADLELPPADLTKYVGPALVATVDALHRSVPTAKIYVDAGLAG